MSREAEKEEKKRNASGSEPDSRFSLSLKLHRGNAVNQNNPNKLKLGLFRESIIQTFAHKTGQRVHVQVKILRETGGRRYPHVSIQTFADTEEGNGLR